MKTLLISLVMRVLIVPVVAALFLIFTPVAFVQDLYFAGTSLALAFAVLAMVWGPFWLGPFSGSSGHGFQRNSNSTQEKKRAQSFKGQARS